jgi:hypothetical protein
MAIKKRKQNLLPAYIAILVLSIIVTAIISVYVTNRNVGTSYTSEMLPQAARARTVFNPMVDVDRSGTVEKTDMEYFQMVYDHIQNNGWSYIDYYVDINHDGKVDMLDGTLIGASFGKTVTKCMWADTDGNGRVTESDYDALKPYYGQQINQYSNRYDYNNDSYITLLDFSALASQNGSRCK